MPGVGEPLEGWGEEPLPPALAGGGHSNFPPLLTHRTWRMLLHAGKMTLPEERRCSCWGEPKEFVGEEMLRSCVPAHWAVAANLSPRRMQAQVDEGRTLYVELY